MDLFRDVLDNQLVDRQEYRLGRVDGIVVELRDGQPPRLDYLEVGLPVLARRLHPRLERWATALLRRCCGGRGLAFRIPWSKVRDIGIDVEVDYEAEETPAMAWEQWIRDHIVGRIPGAG
jgi:hypothetical protein